MCVRLKSNILSRLEVFVNLESLGSKTGYDIIGDIHGQVLELVQLLQVLSYEDINGVWQHSDRKVIFLGDFIDAGEHQQQVIEIVQPMVDNHHAYAVMGNHEYNAIAYYTQDADGNYLRPHTENKNFQHEKFLQAYEKKPTEYQAVLEWFKTLPLWIELDNLRVVHACWDEASIAQIKSFQQGSSFLSHELLQASSIKDSPEYHAVTTILKGKKLLCQMESPLWIVMEKPEPKLGQSGGSIILKTRCRFSLVIIG